MRKNATPRWTNKICSDCITFWRQKTVQPRGPVSDITNPHHLKGKFGEIEVARYLQNRHGLEIARNFGPGTDIMVLLDGRLIRIEVKVAYESSGTWLTGRVCSGRKSDDIVVVVFPIRNFVWFSMNEHLADCTTSGLRDVGHFNNQKSFNELSLERILEKMN